MAVPPAAAAKGITAATKMSNADRTNNNTICISPVTMEKIATINGKNPPVAALAVIPATINSSIAA